MSGRETNEARRARETQEADNFLRRAVPAEFSAFDMDLYPCPNAFAKVMALPCEDRWDENGNERPGYRGGLLLHGETGSGKTRAAFKYLEQRIKTEPEERFTYVSAPILKRRLADAARSGKAQQIIDDLIGDEALWTILFVDDLSQARFTASFAENLFELVDRIYRQRIELVVTVQTNGTDLVRKWCADDRDLTDTAQAIARRLREYCIAIPFKPAQTQAPLRNTQGPAGHRGGGGTP